jgi:Uma2 family endonuclease
MALKRADYFAAGVRRVWQIDPGARTVSVFLAPDQVTVLRETDVLEGGAVLPGFSLSLREFFAELDRQG